MLFGVLFPSKWPLFLRKKTIRNHSIALTKLPIWVMSEIGAVRDLLQSLLSNVFCSQQTTFFVTLTHSLQNHIFCHKCGENAAEIATCTFQNVCVLSQCRECNHSFHQSIHSPTKIHKLVHLKNPPLLWFSELTSRRPSSPEARTRANVDSCPINDKKKTMWGRPQRKAFKNSKLATASS